MASALRSAAARVRARCVVTDEGCHQWTGPRRRDGYVSASHLRRSWLAHRLVYIAEVGDVPSGMELDHTCHNGSGCAGGPLCPHRACVNPAHLEPVTPQTNVRRSPRGQSSTCGNGHAWTPENTYDRGRQGRQCRACNREAARRYQIRRGLRAANVAEADQ